LGQWQTYLEIGGAAQNISVADIAAAIFVEATTSSKVEVVGVV